MHSAWGQVRLQRVRGVGNDAFGAECSGAGRSSSHAALHR